MNVVIYDMTDVLVSAGQRNVSVSGLNVFLIGVHTEPAILNPKKIKCIKHYSQIRKLFTDTKYINYYHDQHHKYIHFFVQIK